MVQNLKSWSIKKSFIGLNFIKHLKKKEKKTCKLWRRNGSQIERMTHSTSFAKVGLVSFEVDIEKSIAIASDK